jgi:DNA polymerase-3 subunit beta
MSRVGVHVGNDVELRAFDFGMSATASFGADVWSRGSTALRPKDLKDSVVGDSVTINSISANHTEIFGAKGSATLCSGNADDFPAWPVDSSPAIDIDINPILLRKAIEKVEFAISDDETRPHLNALKFELSGCRQTLVATDGHRVAMTEFDTGSTLMTAATRFGSGVSKVEFLLPKRAVAILHKALKSTEKSIGVWSFSVSEKRFVASFEAPHWSAGVRYEINLVDVVFPPWRQVIPETFEQYIIMNAGKSTELLATIKSAFKHASDRTGSVTFEISSGNIHISSLNPDRGEFHANVGVTCNVIEPLAIGFNGRYLIDALEAISGTPDTTIGFSGSLDPVLIFSAYMPDKHVVMPMRV